MFRLWDTKLKVYYSGRYNGSVINGKVFNTINGAKQSLKPLYRPSELKSHGEYPIDGTKEEQDLWRQALRAYNIEWSILWEKNKHKSIEELFNNRFTIEELK